MLLIEPAGPKQGLGRLFFAIGAGLAAGSIALVGFGFDSVIEVSSGAIILWRLVSGEHREKLALRLVGVSFLALAAYVAFDAAKLLWLREAAESSYIGIAVAIIGNEPVRLNSDTVNVVTTP